MSFTREEILIEFEEAAELGRRGESDWITWGNVAHSRPAYVALVPYVEPLIPVAVRACPTCGAVVEFREGTRRAIHLGPVMTCERKSA